MLTACIFPSQHVECRRTVVLVEPCTALDCIVVCSYKSSRCHIHIDLLDSINAAEYIVAVYAIIVNGPVDCHWTQQCKVYLLTLFYLNYSLLLCFVIKIKPSTHVVKLILKVHCSSRSHTTLFFPTTKTDEQHIVTKYAKAWLRYSKTKGICIIRFYHFKNYI